MRRATFFEELHWHPDRMVLDDLVFRLQHHLDDSTWDLGGNCFNFYKVKHLVDQYACFWSTRSDFHPSSIVELGIWDGGSLSFWYEFFRPRRHIGIDLLKRQDSAYFNAYLDRKGLAGTFRTHWGLDQADGRTLRETVLRDLAGPLDLVIDDASHMYEPTLASFEVLFPLLRPGGMYVIEDWAWAHWKEFHEPDHPWRDRKALTSLVFELIEATGTGMDDAIANVTAFQGFAVIERGRAALPAGSFSLRSRIARRPDPIRGWVARSCQLLNRWLGGGE